MLRWLARRLVWLAAMLLGVTFATFAVLDLAPADRARVEAERRAAAGTLDDTAARAAAVHRLRVAYGMVDAATGAPRPLLQRYAAWLGNAVRGRFAGPGEDHAALWRRLGEALPVSLRLGGLALLLALLAGVPLGAWLGLGLARDADGGGALRRGAAAAVAALAGVPEFLLGLLLLLGCAGGVVDWFPATGEAPAGAGPLAALHHLALPVAVVASAPFVLVVRFLRDAVARTAAAPFVANLRALGADERLVRARVLRNSLVPLATLGGSLLPMLVGGSIVVENLFALDGIGHLAFRAIVDQDQPLLLALVVLTSVVSLLALLVSDLLHRLVDPRVRLS